MEWQIREKHFKDVENSLKESGCLTKKNKWNGKFTGKKFFELLEKKGHDKSEFEKCKCNIKPKPERQMTRNIFLSLKGLKK